MTDPVLSTTAAARFAACLAAVLEQEGGYSDNPLDPGGATNMGITRKTLAGWRKVTPWTNLPKSAVQSLSRDEAAAIYKALYWTPCHGDDLPAGIDLAVFDYGVNSGPGTSIKALQSELKVVADGVIGPKTLAALAAQIGQTGPGPLITALCDARLNFLQRLATAATFGLGWSRRVASIRTTALAMAGVSATAVSPAEKGPSVNILTGYKTYVVGAAMLIIGIAQLLGITIPSFTGQSAGDLLMQGLAVIFLRQGLSNTVAKS